MTIDFDRELNPAQREAALHMGGPVLVIAGAGSGKTRTIVYRLAHLVQTHVSPENILLLTFTRRASQEMLHRAGVVLGRPLTGASGGTFHSFAYSVLRRNAVEAGYPQGLTLMDRSDSEDLLGELKAHLDLGRGDRSYPKRATLADIITKSRNKELSIGGILDREAYHLLPYQADVERLAEEYRKAKRAQGLMDYDDLLFELERLLLEHPEIRDQLRRRYPFVMVDEYQDTNLVQARLVRLLAGDSGNVMAVGDDAQSIYAFRGAVVANILEFPQHFQNAKLIRLEQNYRSTQPILDLTNVVLAGAQMKFDKHLFTERTGGARPRIIQTLSDQSQAVQAVSIITDMASRHPLHEIAVLFRAGYQSYPLEVALTRAGLPYRKYGGVRFHEAAHVKDILAYLRLAANPADMLAWQRVLGFLKGVGGKTANKIATALLAGDTASLDKHKKRFPDLNPLLGELDALRRLNHAPAAALDRAMSFYAPSLVTLYPDDYPKRQAGLEQLSQIVVNYKSIEDFLADLCLDGTQTEDDRTENAIVLSTVHSAKGLEWRGVILIDLVEDRFPSKKAMQRQEDMEEERRLMYVACTRAKDELALIVPGSVFNRFNNCREPAVTSPFVTELPDTVADRYTETYTGGLRRNDEKLRPGIMTRDDGYLAPVICPEPVRRPAYEPGARPVSAAAAPRAQYDAAPPPKSSMDSAQSKFGLCEHKIFGQGKIVAEIPPDKYRVNFPGFGLKVIVKAYVKLL
ncbi:MAG: ATP-dependent helicase [Humidesulfovibrio sp.]|uniref:ATP-dependent helicase n=1 Tax=Humidesulfovibrio sp. TaxID=2910988 RepID=UPI0027341D17|nr:ATP-dependent helicase [Humidesulfovibrio sp.]MDP2847327.1 ATP-dependent helicase [Humidesulfovibrio sp.]